MGLGRPLKLGRTGKKVVFELWSGSWKAYQVLQETEVPAEGKVNSDPQSGNQLDSLEVWLHLRYRGRVR